MKHFAFTISIEDLIKKRHFHYNNPLDYLINLASTSYDPSGILDISVMPERVKLTTSNALGIDIPKLGDERNILDIATVLPPVPEYGEVTIKSGNEQVTIDQNRKITVHTLEDVINGGEIIVKRDNEGGEEESYFRNKYSWSDLLVRINGETLDSTIGESYRISDEDYEGIIRYDPNSSGGLFFYDRGSIITRQELAKCIDIRLHKHPFEVTESRTKVILGGEMEKEYKVLLSKTPRWLIQFLNSDYVGNPNEQSKESYNAMVQSISSSFPDDDLLQFFALKEGVGNNHK